MLQRCPFDYEVIVVYCDDRSRYYRRFAQEKVENCDVKMYPLDKPDNFHLGTFRNLGSYYASGDTLIIASVDIVRRSNFLQMIDEYIKPKEYFSTVGSFHLPDPNKYVRKYNRYNITKNFDTTVDKVCKEWDNTHDIDYGTVIVDKQDYINMGGYNKKFFFHEDAYLDKRADKYYGEKGAEHPIERLTDTKLFGGFKCKGNKLDKTCIMHGMLIPHVYKTLSNKFLQQPLDDVEPLNMNEKFLKSELYSPWPEPESMKIENQELKRELLEKNKYRDKKNETIKAI